MPIKLSIDDLIKKMFEGGIGVETIRKTLHELGVPSDKIDQVTNSLKENAPEKGDKESQVENEVQEETFSIKEELRRHRLMIEELQQETNKTKLELARLSSIFEALKREKTQNLGIKVNMLEAKVNGLVDAVGEYVPSLLRKLSVADKGA